MHFEDYDNSMFWLFTVRCASKSFTIRYENFKIIRENTVEVLLNTMKHWKWSLSLLSSPLKIFCEDPVAVNDKVQILQSKNIDYESTQTTTDTHTLSLSFNTLWHLFGKKRSAHSWPDVMTECLSTAKTIR